MFIFAVSQHLVCVTLMTENLLVKHTCYFRLFFIFKVLRSIFQ